VRLSLIAYVRWFDSTASTNQYLVNMNYTLNIGLGNNPLDSVDICVQLRKLGLTVTDVDIQKTKETSNWSPEEVLIADIEADMYPSELKVILQRACVITEQDAIAFMAVYEVVPNQGHIAFHPEYKEEIYTFNPQYFKTL
jgi:hypothetical protein